MEHSFGSDNHSGVHPLIITAIIEENKKFATAYGEDPLTKEVLNKIEKLCGDNCSAFFVLNGTGANVVAISPFVKSYNSILAPETAHINVDECGAPEKFSGAKIVSLPTQNGKVTPNVVKKGLIELGNQHHVQAKILSISQPTELGTVYTPDEIKELAKLMHDNDCYLHVDGSRIANAAAALKMPIKSFISDCNVDVLSFGGTKNGLLIGEVVVFFNRDLIDSVKYIRKQATQLYSKSRFIAAQFNAYLKDELYLQLAHHSNLMAKYLEASLKSITEIKITQPVESNAVFAILPAWMIDELHKKYYFYVWNESINEVRWMCSFNTNKEDIDLFVNDIKKLLNK